MGKKVKENTSEELNDSASESVNVDVRKLSMQDFFEENPQTKGEHNSYAAGFKVYWKLDMKKHGLERLSYDEWMVEYNKYLNKEIK